MASVEAPHFERENPWEKTNDTPIETTKKEKDPKRVEAGKRLAALSKQAKERKKKETRVEEPNSWTITPPSGGESVTHKRASRYSLRWTKQPSVARR